MLGCPSGECRSCALGNEPPPVGASYLLAAERRDLAGALAPRGSRPLGRHHLLSRNEVGRVRHLDLELLTGGALALNDARV